MPRRWPLLLAFAGAVLAGSARAVPVPAEVRIALGETTRLGVQWRLAAAFQPGEPVTSPQGRFRLLQAGQCGAVLATRTRALNTTADGQGSVRLRERVRVDAALGLAAREAGGEGLCYERVFTGALSQTQVTDTLRLPLTGALGAAAVVVQVRLRFEDGSLGQLVARGEVLTAVAEISARGEGRLRAVWEVATPVTTGGVPGFRRIGLVQRRFFGGGTLRLVSPPLPTAIPGLHLVRLRVLEPDSSLAPAELRYFVRLPTAGAAPPAPLGVLGPADGARLGEGLRFRWQAAAGAHAYRLEFYAPGEDPGRDPPRTGLWLPRDVRESGLTPLVRRRLAEARRWRWRVVAFDAAGRLVAASPLRRLGVE